MESRSDSSRDRETERRPWRVTRRRRGVTSELRLSRCRTVGVGAHRPQFAKICNNPRFTSRDTAPHAFAIRPRRKRSETHSNPTALALSSLAPPIAHTPATCHRVLTAPGMARSFLDRLVRYCTTRRPFVPSVDREGPPAARPYTWQLRPAPSSPLSRGAPAARGPCTSCGSSRCPAGPQTPRRARRPTRSCPAPS